ncbi:hypothetical protein HPP92_002089 [Vanilla planifolia]|uniref:non-specific serine/threonine protein kinase n=1 Tax=Vanilla planifolia TaxID=51239 RepID=A0A835RV79_VANPL|nr:hypothetical protein HPP92_002089 [Vanilla planifolia]
MPALFRIVQDAHPPIPEGLSVDITDFLRQCFKKDAMQRPDARTLLQHPWIQNSRRVLPSSLRQIGGSIRNIDEDVAVADNNSAENVLGGDRPLEVNVIFDNILRQDQPKKTGYSKRKSLEGFIGDRFGKSTSSDENLSAKNNIAHDASLEGVDTLKDDLLSAKDPTLVFHQNPATALSSNDASTAHLKSGNEPFQDVRNGMGDATAVAKQSVGSGVHELSRFSDAPGDALLDDLFQPINRDLGDQGLGASTSATAHENVIYDGSKSDLARELKARMAQKHMENAIEQKGGKLLKYVMEVFEDNLPTENIFLIQSVEFSKLVGMLKPEEPEDVILSACHKLLAFFDQRPEQKHVFISQHGFFPLMDLLEVPRNRVICSVLQIINQIVMDNVGFQENACLVGLIPVVMNFAVPDRLEKFGCKLLSFFSSCVNRG